MADSEHTRAGPGESRRDFLYLATGALGAAGSAVALWPLIHQMDAAADTLALETIEVDLSPIETGQSITVLWQGKPVFIRRRSDAEIEEARAVALDALPDPQSDMQRARKPEWLIVVGVCTHLGCIPKGQATRDRKGEYGGWLCPCHWSHYDTSGRIRKGPAPKNLPVPTYEFLSDSRVRIG